ncbi:MAG: PIG-L family deacetylase [Phycisphaerales bacterium]|nr:PIG-L family deacetylase [Phycisphaerales bacterium]
MRILVAGPHPDDQELGMGGTIARLAEQGHEILLLDMTDGEPTPHGDPETRAKEAEHAARTLGVRRRNLGLRNRYIEHSIETRHAVAGVLREERIEVIFTPYFLDAHPDHVATTRIVEDARFDAKLTKIDLPGDPCHPRRLIYYFCTHLKIVPQPSFIFDTTGFQDRRRQAILAYESQFVVPEKNRAIVDWIDASATFYGSRIGCESGEPFYVHEPMGVQSLDGFL